MSRNLPILPVAHFAAAVANLRIMEVDIDRLPWDQEVFTTLRQFENGQLIVADTSD